ncbi:MAG TPA: cytochrome C oxidase subunit IV family protein [Pyrinomonadaceae bacterium]|nr:cytochrome C oxidase subunit IV family protein [Pyrinomonadaceae bacterium]
MKRPVRNYNQRRKLSPIVSFFFHLKRNHLWLRRFAFLWLFLIALEISCPILECQDLEDFSSPEITATVNFVEFNSSESATKQHTNDESITAVNSPLEHCGDECLCHVTAILGLNFDFPKVNIEYSPVLISYNKQPIVSLSPPIQPPKRA